GGLFAKGAERRPFAADHAELGHGAFDAVHEMAARDSAGEFMVAAGQRADSAITEHDMLRPGRDAGKHASQRVEDVVPLLRFAAYTVGSIDADIGGADQYVAEIGEHDAHPAVGVLEEYHVAAE